jgi:hypothetical protein
LKYAWGDEKYSNYAQLWLAALKGKYRLAGIWMIILQWIS